MYSSISFLPDFDAEEDSITVPGLDPALGLIQATNDEEPILVKNESGEVKGQDVNQEFVEMGKPHKCSFCSLTFKLLTTAR